MGWSFSDKVALVTGAGSGMGLTTARAFAEAGAAVALADVNENAVRSAAEELVSAGHKAIGIRCNVADEAEVAAMVAQTVSTFGRLDAAFNNAGIQSPAVEMADVSGEEFERVNGINLRGVWNCMKYELRQMREQGSGAIVNNSSIGGLIGIAGRAAYHASKHGVIGLTKSAALEYASRGICINAVCPGTIDTPMVTDMLAKEPDAMKDILKDQPIGRLGRPEEIASAVLWLCSPWRKLRDRSRARCRWRIHRTVRTKAPAAPGATHEGNSRGSNRKGQIRVQCESLLSGQCDIATGLRYDSTARFDRTRRAAPDFLLRHLPLRSSSGP